MFSIINIVTLNKYKRKLVKNPLYKRQACIFSRQAYEIYVRVILVSGKSHIFINFELINHHKNNFFLP